MIIVNILLNSMKDAPQPIKQSKLRYDSSYPTHKSEWKQTPNRLIGFHTSHNLNVWDWMLS